MIPKIVHYCWLSNDPVPEYMHRYMETWKKHLPDYEFMKWDFNRFEKKSSIWVSEAFDNKKYAFAADYIRLYALYNYGGIYLDMDVEVLKSFNTLLKYDIIMGYETRFKCTNKSFIEAAVIGSNKHAAWVKYCLEYYDGKHFINPDGSSNNRPIPQIMVEILEQQFKIVNITHPEEIENLQGNQIPILPCNFFSPKDQYNRKVYVNENTYCIHHYDASWNSGFKVRKKLIDFGLSPSIANFISGYMYSIPISLFKKIINKLSIS